MSKYNSLPNFAEANLHEWLPQGYSDIKVGLQQNTEAAPHISKYCLLFR